MLSSYLLRYYTMKMIITMDDITLLTKEVAKGNIDGFTEVLFEFRRKNVLLLW